MEYSDAYLREVIPREDPPYERVPGDVEDEIRRWIERSGAEDPGLIARSVRWTYAIFAELGEGAWRFQRGFFRGWPEYMSAALNGLAARAAVGLFDREREMPGFGLIMSAPVWPGPSFDQVDYVEFPRLKAVFPLGVRYAEIEPHAPVHPQGATSACWARCNTTGLWGVITAGHAVGGNRPGRPVPLDGGGVGSLVRSYYQPVDAAFVHVSPPPAAPAPLTTLAFPAAGQGVVVETQGGPQARTVVGAMDSMGVLHTREFGILFHMDQPCVPGDSGSLVRTAAGEAVGVYKGQMKTPQTQYPVVGLAQNFEQAVYALDVTPFS